MLFWGQISLNFDLISPQSHPFFFQVFLLWEPFWPGRPCLQPVWVSSDVASLESLQYFNCPKLSEPCKKWKEIEDGVIVAKTQAQAVKSTSHLTNFKLRQLHRLQRVKFKTNVMMKIVDQVVEKVLDLIVSPSPALVPQAKLAFVVLERRVFSTHGRNLALKQVLTSCQF